MEARAIASFAGKEEVPEPHSKLKILDAGLADPERPNSQ